MFKKLALLLCAVALLLLVACKQYATAPNDENSTVTSLDQTSDDGGKITSSGIELEEDVFVENHVTNNQNSGASSNTSATTSGDGTVSNNNSSNNSTSSDTSSDEESNTSSEENDVIVDNDGTIRLPIDKFN